MYLSVQRVASDGTVKTFSAFTDVPKATHVELMSETQNIRYTMDNTTAPASGGAGMLLRTIDPPKPFLIEDMKRLKFTQDAGGAGVLHAHFFGGRDV